MLSSASSRGPSIRCSAGEQSIETSEQRGSHAELRSPPPEVPPSRAFRSAISVLFIAPIPNLSYHRGHPKTTLCSARHLQPPHRLPSRLLRLAILSSLPGPSLVLPHSRSLSKNRRTTSHEAILHSRRVLTLLPSSATRHTRQSRLSIRKPLFTPGPSVPVRPETAPLSGFGSATTLPCSPSRLIALRPRTPVSKTSSDLSTGPSTMTTVPPLLLRPFHTATPSLHNPPPRPNPFGLSLSLQDIPFSLRLYASPSQVILSFQHQHRRNGHL